jgi:DnaJ-class molecular chaperone
MADWEQYDFYRVLEVEPTASAEEIEKAFEARASTFNPDNKPQEQKRAAAMAFVVADAARQTLSDQRARDFFDAKLKGVKEADSEKTKVEEKRKGKLQEQQTIEEDEKLKRASVRYEAAKSALAEFYYDQLFKAARASKFTAVPSDTVVEWLSFERAESMRKSEQRGRRTSFRIGWEGFVGIQDMRKKRGQEIVGIVDELVTRFGLR